MTTQTLHNKRAQLFADYVLLTGAMSDNLRNMESARVVGDHVGAGHHAALLSIHRNGAQDTMRALRAVERQINGNE